MNTTLIRTAIVCIAIAFQGCSNKVDVVSNNARYEEHVASAAKLASNGLHKDALAEYQKALQIKPNDKDVLWAMMDSHILLGEYLAAKNDIEQHITYHGTTAKLLAYKSLCESKLGLTTASMTAFDSLKLSHSEKSNPSRKAAEIFCKKWVKDDSVYHDHSAIFDKAAWVMAGKGEIIEAGSQIAYLELAIVEGSKLTTQEARNKLAEAIDPIRNLAVTFDF